MDQAQLQLEELEVECRRLTEQRAEVAPRKPRIAAWGVVKAGKSSLLNMLSGHALQEHFETGVVRTTRVNQELELEHYVLIDTPGLGIDQDDSQEAMEGLDLADVLLFVHAPPGELDEEEVDLLMTLRNAYGDAIEQRLVLVLSHLDKDQNGSMAEVRERIEAQVLRCLGIKPACFEVSSTRYRRGVEIGREGLQGKSGIPALALHLNALSRELGTSLMAVRQKRLDQRSLQLSAMLDEAIEREQGLIQALNAPYANKANAFVELMSGMIGSFADKTAEIKKAREKLNSL